MNIAVAWTPSNSPNVATQNLYRANGTVPASQFPTGFTKIGNLLSSAETTYTDNPGQGTFTYVATATGTNGVESGPSNAASATIDTTPPNPPTNLTATTN